MDDNFFAQLQALSVLGDEENSIMKSREQLRQIVDYFQSRPEYEEQLTIFANEVRHLEVSTLRDCDSFMVDEDVLPTEIPEELRHDSLGFCKGVNIIFSGRYVYPVKDVKGNVMGFCGYDKFSDVKYLDSLNYGYKAKTFSMWGMERLPEYYRDNEPVYFVEGIVCALYLRQRNLHSLAMLGSNVSPYCRQIINRFKTRAVVVCDSDEAGTKCRRSLKRTCPLARCVQSRIAKDVDDSRQVDDTFADELGKMKNPFYASKLFG